MLARTDRKAVTGFSLPVKLLFLSLVFVSLAEILIFLPSIGREQKMFLNNRLSSAHLAILALQAAPEGKVSDKLKSELLQHANALLVGLKKRDGPNMLLTDEKFKSNLPVNHEIDLRKPGILTPVSSALETLVTNRIGTRIRVLGLSPKDSEYRVEIVMDSTLLIQHLRYFAQRIMVLSFFISLFVGILLYFSLIMMLVRPLNRLNASMLRFAQAPDTETILMPEKITRDELNITQRRLGEMQETVRTAFRERAHLAALGTAVSKINHDLRNLLATPLLLSDTLETSDDPKVRRIAPRLIEQIENAVQLCRASLKFANNKTAEPERETFTCLSLFEKIQQRLAENVGGGTNFIFKLPSNSRFHAEKTQLDRLFSNLFINAIQAGATSIEVLPQDKQPGDKKNILYVRDNGPGLRTSTLKNLFIPFASTTKKDGSGLGLSIVKSIMEVHGGKVALAHTSKTGTTFSLTFNPRTLIFDS